MAQYRYKGRSSSVDQSPEDRFAIWIKYIDAIPWAPGEFDHQEFAAFSKAAYYGIEADSAFSLILDKMKRAGAQKLRRSKIRHSLARAYSNGGFGSRREIPALSLPPVEPYNEELLRDTVGELAAQVDECFFIDRSPVTPWNRTPAGVLHKLSLPSEHIWITANACSADGCLFTHRDSNNCSAQWISVTGHIGGPEEFEPNFKCLSFLEHNQPNVWFLNNPVNGEAYYDPRFTYGLSYHCLEAITSWRYLVMETDVAPANLWLALLALVPIRIAAIYFSGGRGHHALVRINAASKPEADDICEIYKREYSPFGACKGNTLSFPLTRLPNCFRGKL